MLHEVGGWTRIYKDFSVDPSLLKQGFMKEDESYKTNMSYKSIKFWKGAVFGFEMKFYMNVWKWGNKLQIWKRKIISTKGEVNQLF